MLRLRSALREFFPAALQAFADLDAPDALELLAEAPDPDRAARLTRRTITAALRRADRRDTVEARADADPGGCCAPQELRQPPAGAGGLRRDRDRRGRASSPP